VSFDGLASHGGRLPNGSPLLGEVPVGESLLSKLTAGDESWVDVGTVACGETTVAGGVAEAVLLIAQGWTWRRRVGASLEELWAASGSRWPTPYGTLSGW